MTDRLPWLIALTFASAALDRAGYEQLAPVAHDNPTVYFRRRCCIAR
jgi:hypothetical protein